MAPPPLNILHPLYTNFHEEIQRHTNLSSFHSIYSFHSLKHFLQDSMQLFQCANTFHKYYPGLSLSKDVLSFIEPQQDIFCQSFSISRLASSILDSHEVQSSCSEAGSLENSLLHCFANGDERQKERQRKCNYRVDSDAKGCRKNSWSDMPRFFVAGTVSTVISRTCVAPLERIKLECIVQDSKQTWINIVRWIWISEGLRGFWKGNMINLFRMVPFKTINFLCYDFYLNSLHSIRGKKKITNIDRLIGGGISGVTATVLCLPLDTIRTRLIAPGGDALGGVAGCFLHMLQTEGFFSLYKGLTPALISMVPANAVFYAVYDILKSSHLSSSSKSSDDKNEIGVMRTLVYSAIAGACAETGTYPLEVIRRQLQLQRSTHLSLASAFIKLIEREGLGSLFVGLIPSTLQVLPSAALSYLFYEMMKSFLKIN